MIDIQALHNKRINYVETARENNFEDGLLNLLTELYPDNAHFIYELLQNAEDTGATKIQFKLDKDYLEFYHNGTRHFSYKDVESITSIGDSTKKDDVNKIGKFGVGFKAVFAYTSEPHIYSKDIAFKIEHLFVPSEIPASPISEPYTTKMVFPFNHHTKNPSEAFVEIKQHLDALGDETLLFLNNIEEIKWKIGNSLNHIARQCEDDHIVKIDNTVKGSTSHWLRFLQPYQGSEKLFVAIAFGLNLKTTSKYEITPVDGKVSIFFPAEKETSKLKFHIHAPFASTVARDSIKDSAENLSLMNEIALLTVKSLNTIKDLGLLATEFLGILPILDDDLTPLYEKIRVKIHQAFKEEPLVPTDCGRHSTVNNLFQMPQDLKKTISIEDISIFESYGHEDQRPTDLFLVKNARQQNSRTDKFLQILKIEKWGWDKFGEELSNACEEIHLYNGAGAQKLKRWLNSKTNEWIVQLYATLYDGYLKGYLKCSLDEFSLLVKTKKGFNFNLKQVYLCDKKTSLDKSLCFDESIFASIKNEKLLQKAQSFLEECGVKTIDDKEKLKLIFDKYYAGDMISISDDAHLEHIQLLLDYYKKHRNIDEFKKYNIFFKCTYDDTVYWTPPKMVVIDDPYIHTGMKALGPEIKQYILSDLYIDTAKNNQYFIEMLKNLGVVSRLSINKTHISVLNPNRSNLMTDYLHNDARERHETLINEDYEIENIELMLELNRLSVARLIWNCMCNATPSELLARYRPNKKYQTKTADSYLITVLKSSKWIPSKNGKFFKPSDISKSEIHESLIYNNNNGWLDAIEFGQEIQKQQEEYIAQENQAKALGFDSVEEVNLFKKLKENMSKDEINDLIAKKEQSNNQTQSLKESLTKHKGNGDSQNVTQQHHDEIIIDEDKHASNVHDENVNIPTRFRTSTSSHKTQDKQQLVQVGSFLKHQYDGHCQVCGDTFQHKGNNFFKMRSLNLGKNRDINRKGNTLCLCSKHWDIFDLGLVGFDFVAEIKEYDTLKLELLKQHFEEYDWVGKEDINQKNDAFYMLDDQDSFSKDELFFLPIKIFNQPLYIKMSKEHLIEFVEVWNHN
jgi:hypothetical protein